MLCGNFSKNVLNLRAAQAPLPSDPPLLSGMWPEPQQKDQRRRNGQRPADHTAQRGRTAQHRGATAELGITGTPSREGKRELLFCLNHCCVCVPSQQGTLPPISFSVTSPCFQTDFLNPKRGVNLLLFFKSLKCVLLSMAYKTAIWPLPGLTLLPHSCPTSLILP